MVFYYTLKTVSFFMGVEHDYPGMSLKNNPTPENLRKLTITSNKEFRRKKPNWKLDTINTSELFLTYIWVAILIGLYRIFSYFSSFQKFLNILLSKVSLLQFTPIGFICIVVICYFISMFLLRNRDIYIKEVRWMSDEEKSKWKKATISTYISATCILVFGFLIRKIL
jgi:FlaA1/EpsC-like NDP-sugar epimerase